MERRIKGRDAAGAQQTDSTRCGHTTAKEQQPMPAHVNAGVSFSDCSTASGCSSPSLPLLLRSAEPSCCRRSRTRKLQRDKSSTKRSENAPDMGTATCQSNAAQTHGHTRQACGPAQAHTAHALTSLCPRWGRVRAPRRCCPPRSSRCADPPVIGRSGAVNRQQGGESQHGIAGKCREGTIDPHPRKDDPVRPHSRQGPDLFGELQRSGARALQRQPARGR